MSLGCPNPLSYLLQVSTVASPIPPAVNIIQRPASSPNVVRLPASQLQQIVQTAQTSASQPGGQQGKKIITVKRVGPNGSVTQSRSFTISADAAKNLTGSQKIIVQRSNGGTQVVRTGSPVPHILKQTVPGSVSLPVSLVQTQSGNTVVTNIIKTESGEMYIRTEPSVTYIRTEPSATQTSFANQFLNFAQSMQSTAQRINIKQEPSSANTAEIRTQPHVIQVSRPISSSGPTVLQRPVTQTARLVSSQSVVNTGSPTIRVIQRPFQNSSPPVTLQHSQSVPANLATYNNLTNIPQSLLNNRNCDSPPLIISRQPGLGASKMVLNDASFMNGLYGQNPMGMSTISAMQHSVQNLTPAKMTSKDVSRMWSNQDMRLKSISSNMNAPVSL